MKTLLMLVTIIVLGSGSALALEYKIVKTKSHYNLDGTSKHPLASIVDEYSLISNSHNKYNFNIKNTISVLNAKPLVTFSENESHFTSEEVQNLSSSFGQCSVPELSYPPEPGKIETITIKAGMFVACKRVRGNFTVWTVDNFPFEVKIFYQDESTIAIYEASEVVINK